MAARFTFPGRYEIGAGCLDKLGERSRPLGHHVFLLTGSSALQEAGVVASAEGALTKAGLAVSRFEGISGNPTTDEVSACARALVESEADVVVALGGGSVLDTAKLAAALARQGGEPWDFVSMPERPARPVGPEVLPMVLVPSTAGTASETTPFAVLTNPALPLKKGIASPHLYPREVLVDPEIHALQPPVLTARAGFDGLGQNLEAWSSGRGNTVSDAFAREGFQRIWEALPEAVARGGDLSLREQVAIGVSLSGLAITGTDVNLAHAIAHALGGRLDMHHGLAVALMTPAATRFNAAGAPARFAPIHQLLGTRDADCLAECLRDYLVSIGLPPGLTAHGVTEAMIPTLADEAMQIGSIRTGPVPVSQSDVESLLRESL